MLIRTITVIIITISTAISEPTDDYVMNQFNRNDVRPSELLFESDYASGPCNSSFLIWN